MIRAKVVGEREVVSGNDIYGNPIKRIQYDIKQIKVKKKKDKKNFLCSILFLFNKTVYSNILNWVF